MATINIWIQIENHWWDSCPNGMDRMTSEVFSSVPKTLKSPLTNATQVSRVQNMFRPLKEEALILRRYKPPGGPILPWTVPDDRKVNPWDLNEPDPTDTGTMGTIPGPVVECSVGNPFVNNTTPFGDTVIVHFRNMDMRTRTVVHPAVTHQVVHPAVTHQVWNLVWTHVQVWKWIWIWVPSFVPTTVLDAAEWTETVIDKPEFTTEEDLAIEKRLHSLHTHGFVFDAKMDGAYPLSPPDIAQPIGSESPFWALVPGFTATPTTVGKQGDRVPPHGTFTYKWETFGWPTTTGVWLYHDHSVCDTENVELGAIGIVVIHATPADVLQDVDIRQAGNPNLLDPAFLPHHLSSNPAGSLLGSPVDNTNTGSPLYRVPSKALFLQLFHGLNGAPTCINGRTFLGNTPTMIASPTTLMRFGVIGMGSEFHTFHIHGRRWVIAGPNIVGPNIFGNDVLQFGGPLTTPTSQNEDTRTFGPANSFSFSIHEGGPVNGFMGAVNPLGEWHMHCHVLMHMMTGMMGSLLIVNDGQAVTDLPMGLPCPDDDIGGKNRVIVKNNSFTPASLMVASGTMVTFDFQEMNHTVTTVPPPSIIINRIEINGGNNTPTDSGIGTPIGARSISISGNSGDVINYECGIHGNFMSGSITIM